MEEVMRSLAGKATLLATFAGTSILSCGYYPPYTFDMIELDCLDGVDDDDDGDIDCEDPDCNPGYTCAAPVPDGWKGYVALYDGPPGELAFPTDFAEVAYMGNRHLSAPDAVCKACSCGTPIGQRCVPQQDIDVAYTTCNDPNQGLYTSLQLPGEETCCHPFNPVVVGGQQDCSPGGDSACIVSLSAASPTVAGGACVPAGGGVALLPPVTWSLLGAAYGGASIGGGCDSERVCQPMPGPPFIGLCIFKAGLHDCSEEFIRYVYYETYEDDRGCEPCSCSDPKGSTCSIDIDLYANKICSGSAAASLTVGANGGCVDVAGNPSLLSASVSVEGPSGGDCDPSPAKAIGGAIARGATTFCCADGHPP